MVEVVTHTEYACPAGVTLRELIEATGAPMTQVNVALAFLKERGCVITRFRRHWPASTFVFEDAMIEYFALAETPLQRSE